MGIGKILTRLERKENKFYKVILWLYNHLPFNNKFKLRKNKLTINVALLKGCNIQISGGGHNNSILIDKGCRLVNCKFIIRGNNNTVKLSEFITAKNAEFYIEDDNNKIICGKRIKFSGKIHLACTEGKQITIGEDCLFSSEIFVRTGDSHSVVDLNGNRINQAKDVKIGNHVWVGHRVMINKGVQIAENSVVGAGAVLTKVFEKPNVCIAGVPAKIIKENISWQSARI